jgi:hypothetical protein
MDVNNNENSMYKITPVLFVWLVVLLSSIFAVLAITELFSEEFLLTSTNSGAYFLVFSVIAILIYVYSFSYFYGDEVVTVYRFGKLKGTYHFNNIVKLETGGRLNHWGWLDLTFRDGKKITVDSFYKNEFRFYTDVYLYVVRVGFPLSDKQKKWFDYLNKVK